MRKKLITGIFLIIMIGIVYSCNSEAEIQLTTYITNGKDIYKAKCQNCHGENGEGLGALAPPLTDTTFLKVNKSKLACIVKNGANRPMLVNGKNYHEKMPAFKEMENIDLAQVVVYITNSFGNKQGMYTYEQVANDLSKCK